MILRSKLQQDGNFLAYHVGWKRRRAPVNRFIRDDTRIGNSHLPLGWDYESLMLGLWSLRLTSQYRKLLSENQAEPGRDGEAAHCAIFFGCSDMLKTVKYLIGQKRIFKNLLNIYSKLLTTLKVQFCITPIQLGVFFGRTFWELWQLWWCLFKMKEDWTIGLIEVSFSCVARCQRRFGIRSTLLMYCADQKSKILQYKARWSVWHW